jgi:LysM repeat protein
MKRLAVFVILFAIVTLLLELADPKGFRNPLGLAAQTEEPTKPPYVFPTPIFIPTFPEESLTPTRAPTLPTGTPTPTRTPTPTLPAGIPTGTPAPEQTYTVQSGDSPWIIAQKVYGDGTKYPLIMTANNMTSTTRLRTGTVLIIPPLPGAPVPTPTPLATLAPMPTLAPTTTPTPAPTATATPTPTPTATSLIPSAIVSAAAIAINILSAMLLVGALLFAVLAVLLYARSRRLETSAFKKELRFRQK